MTYRFKIKSRRGTREFSVVDKDLEDVFKDAVMEIKPNSILRIVDLRRVGSVLIQSSLGTLRVQRV